MPDLQTKRDVSKYNKLAYIYHKGINNVFRGNYEGIPYEIVSSNYSVPYMGDRGRCYQAHFNRIIVSLDLNKNFRSRTLIKRNCGIVHIFGLRRIPIGDMYFRNNYGVFTNNKQDAMSLITPEFIDALTKLRPAFGVEKVDCAFYEGKVLFALDAEQDAFEINHLGETLFDETQYEGILKNIISILELINHMKSSLKI